MTQHRRRGRGRGRGRGLWHRWQQRRRDGDAAAAQSDRSVAATQSHTARHHGVADASHWWLRGSESGTRQRSSERERCWLQVAVPVATMARCASNALVMARWKYWCARSCCTCCVKAAGSIRESNARRHGAGGLLMHRRSGRDAAATTQRRNDAMTTGSSRASVSDARHDTTRSNRLRSVAYYLWR